MRWVVWSLLLTALVFALIAPRAFAQGPVSRVQSTHPIPLLVDGLRQTGFPKDLPMGTQVCVPGETTYIGEGERYHFVEWRLGVTRLPSLCILAVDAGPYTAVFQREVLVRVTSNAPGIAQSRWVEEGGLLPLAAPEVIPITDDQRWRFTSWSGGITPFSRENTALADRPLTLEARYALEYRVQVVAPEGVTVPGDGWYAAGQTVSLRAPATVSEGPGRRLRLVGWVGEGVPASALQEARTLLTFPVNGPATLQPQYVREFLVEGYGLRDVRLSQTWATEGAVVSVSAPETVLVEEGVRWRFVEWSGGMEPTQPTTRVVASRPLVLQARYTQEYLVRVLAPEGVTVSGAGWYAPGQSITLRLPDTVMQGEDQRWRWVGWETEPPGTVQGTVVTVTVSQPITLRPRYALEFLVEARTPRSVLLQEWKGAGATLSLEAPPTLDDVPLRFWRERGTGEVVGGAPSLTLQVTRPLRLEAVYETPRPPGTVTLQANAPVVLTGDGQEISTFPATLPAGSKICVPSPHTYTGEGERYRFVRWSTGSQEACLVAPAGSLTAFFEREVLLTITSPLAGIEATRWVTANQPVPLEVPTAVDAGDTRWRFAGWSTGETPFSTTNTVVLTKPLTVEAKFVPEYRISIAPVEGVTVSGEGWYPAGARALLRTAPMVQKGEGSRLRFLEWEESEGRLIGVSTDKPELVIAVNGPLSLRPRYVQEYRVQAENPQGILTLTWVEEGKTLELETPSLISIVEEEERLRFSHWQEKVPGAQPLSQVAKLILTVDRPLNLEGVYRREFKVNLQAPYGGSGAGWYVQNTTAIISVPPQPQAVLFLKKTFQGFAGYPQTGPVLQVTVQGPLTIAALYRNEVDFRVLAFLVVGLLVAFLIWRVTEARAARQPSAPAQEQEEEIIEEIVEEEPQPPIATGRRAPPDRNR